MPIWGEFQVSWRNVVPPVLIAVAVACLALSLRGCLWPGSETPPPEVHFEEYRRQLDSGDPGLIVAAIKLLGGLGDPRAVEPIRQKLRADDPRIVGAALAALGRLGDKSITDQLLESVRRDDPALVAGAAEGLGALKVKQAVEPLAKLVEQRDYAVRLAAVVALGEIGDPAAQAALAKLESDPAAGLSPAPNTQERARLEEALGAALAKLSNAK